MGQEKFNEGSEDEWPASPGRESESANERLLSEEESSHAAAHDEEKTDEIGEKKKKPPPPPGTATFSSFMRIFTYSTHGDRILLLVATVASIFTGVTMPLMNIIFARLVGTFGKLYSVKEGEGPQAFLNGINGIVMYLVYLFAARLALGYVALFGFRMASLRISAAMRLAYIKALFLQPISTLDVLPPGQTAAIITVTANTLQVGISERLSMLIQNVSLIITALIIAVSYNWLLTLVTSSGLVFIALVYRYTIPRFVNSLKEVGEADRMSSGIASEAFTSIRMVAACGAEDKMASRYASWVEESHRRGLRMSPLVALQQAPSKICALAFWFAVKLYQGEYITSLTTMIIVLTSVLMIMTSLGGTVTPASAAMHAAGAASIFFTIIDAPQPRTSGLGGPHVSSQEDIVFENVNFTYPLRADVKVLDNLSLRFPAGKTTAIVGASGSGKSTIVGLIERWYELDGNMTDNMITLYFRNGTIKSGDKPLQEIDLKWWRSQIALVQQEPFLFNDTIYKNVENGLIGTEWEFASTCTKCDLVKQACREAFADEFITRLPQGYETSVGDAGIKLSGGQRQRIAIARSIVKQPKILILDEATSAIDVHGEKIVQAALDKVSKNRTTITIAHRLSTIMKADNIVVLKKGQVVQQGSHDQLLADTEGAYWHLANAQQLSLGDDKATTMAEIDDAASEASDLTAFGRISDDSDRQELVEAESYVLKGFFGSFGSLLWEQKPHFKWYFAMLLSALGAGAAFPIQSFLSAKIFSVFSLYGESLASETSWWCLMFTALAVFVGVSYFVLGWSANTISFHITSTYRREYFSNVLKKPISFFDDEENSIGSLTSRMATDPTQLQQLLGINMAFVVISLFNIVGCVALSFYFGWKLTLAAVITSMPIILAAAFFRFRFETQFEKMNYAVFAESSKFATESIGAFRTVSSLTLESEICGRYQKLLEEHIQSAFNKAGISTLVFALSDSIPLLCMSFVLWYGGQLLATFQYAPFNYLVVYLAIVQGSISAGQFLSFGPNIAQASASANRIRGMRPTDLFEVTGKELDFSATEDEEKEQRGLKIELKDVWFRYPTRDVPVLTGLDMTIEAGQFAAIVGPSGCGKTSIICLLERFYNPERGSIHMHGTDVTRLSLSGYRSHISLVSQEASLFEGSIRDNILLGVDANTTSDSAIHLACQQAEIHEFIISLPSGYATEVGTRGIALSGGQKQRIAIARALIRNPRVLLLDEATSNLDSETEREVQNVFEKTGKGKGRTMVVVAHRLATVQNADVIFVVEGGRVVEKGNHNELLALRSTYWQMCQAQALDR
ncbi:related to multidrug resistance protein [Rhynchosporium secalis]|uniref:Related to multidrug resistance protein n=1 Tax=Rhynchosporium secalis TaxID=38038 RepID=A0A1E1ML83_RHYSE|nr:related to multidrug resistance protein [Rhynchosporium secalis]